MPKRYEHGGADGGSDVAGCWCWWRITERRGVLGFVGGVGVVRLARGVMRGGGESSAFYRRCVEMGVPCCGCGVVWWVWGAKKKSPP